MFHSVVFALFLGSFSSFPPAAVNLIEGIDVAVIEAYIAKYQEENAEQIMVNRARKVLKMVSSVHWFKPFHIS